ncbi:hypothetical protein [Nocardia sp. NPDC049149]|uniref:hypothetical protein n=1 Tax=Nocardia sp. NPDC049149 TaxID=3364315 RepID=UPI003716D3F2
MADDVPQQDIQARHRDYMSTHYISIYTTTVSVVLGIAGLAFGALLAAKDHYGNDYALFWLLGAVALAASVLTYAGSAIGAIALPPGVPGLLDLLLPLGICMSQFMMFAPLVASVADLPPRVGVVTWLASECLFGVCASATVRRVRTRVDAYPHYSGTSLPWIKDYIARLRSDGRGSAMVAAFGGISTVVFLALPQLSLAVAYVPAVAIGLGLAWGMRSNAISSGILHKAFDVAPTSPAG